VISLLDAWMSLPKVPQILLFRLVQIGLFAKKSQVACDTERAKAASEASGASSPLVVLEDSKVATKR
jgi:hypothetical protein